MLSCPICRYKFVVLLREEKSGYPSIDQFSEKSALHCRNGKVQDASKQRPGRLECHKKEWRKEEMDEMKEKEESNGKMKKTWKEEEKQDEKGK